jgi:hypothetical protein
VVVLSLLLAGCGSVVGNAASHQIRAADSLVPTMPLKTARFAELAMGFNGAEFAPPDDPFDPLAPVPRLVEA